MQLYYKVSMLSMEVIPIFLKIHLPEVKQLYYYPENMAARATFWLWELRDLVAIGISLLLSVLALTQTGLMLPMIGTALFTFLSIRFDGVCILDFIRYASAFFMFKPQLYEWRPRYEE